MTQQELNYVIKRANEGKKDYIYKLSKMYYDGEDVPQDHGLAKAWMDKYIEVGGGRYLGEVAYLLGKMLFNGDGCEQEQLLAIQYFVASYGENYYPAYDILRMLIKGGAIQHLELVGQQMELPAFVLDAIGDAYANGSDGVGQSDETAKMYYNKALAGNIDLTNQILIQRKISDINIKEERRVQEAEAEAERQRLEAEKEAERQRLEAEAEAERIRKENEDKAKRQALVDAAESGDTKAMYNYAMALLQGTDGFEKDVDKGMEMMLKAAEAKNHYAEYKLGMTYKYGYYGQKKNNYKARKYLARAANHHIGYSVKEYNDMLTLKEKLFTNKKKK